MKPCSRGVLRWEERRCGSRLVPGAGCTTVRRVSSHALAARHQAPSVRHQRQVAALDASTATETATETATAEDARADEYNKQMTQRMQWGELGDLDPYQYHPQRGLYWHEIAPGLICGTQPRSGDDVAQLHSAGVTHIVSLQTDSDLKYWSVNLDELRHRCSELGVMHVRRMARDFDPHSLRKTLPSAVSSVHHALSNQGRVYVHCTAGLGRAPAVCIAYMFWFMGMDLDTAYKSLTDIRPCGPKRDAIRGATFDLLSGSHWDAFNHLAHDAWADLSEEDRYALQWRVLKHGAH